jgi:hypothetical protein
LPWHVRKFRQAGAAGDEKIPYSAHNCQMISSLRQNDRDNRDISSILEGPWRVTDELIKMVQYFFSFFFLVFTILIIL